MIRKAREAAVRADLVCFRATSDAQVPADINASKGGRESWNRRRGGDGYAE